MEKVFKQIKFKTNMDIRTVFHDGKKCYVLPVVMMKEGVHTGSGGAFYYPEETISANAFLWNGVPVPVYHPFDENGLPISCRSPEIVEKYNVGRIYNAKFEDGKLSAEAWIEADKVEKIAPGLIAALHTGAKIDVSTGVFTTDDPVSGTWNNEEYSAVIKTMTPDHLAILPGMDGACSWADGCGIRANSALSDNAGFSDGDIRDALRSAVNDKYGIKNRFHFVREVFSKEKYFIYESVPNMETPSISNEKEALYKQDFSVDYKGRSVSIGDEREEVKMVTDFVKANSDKNINNEDKKMEVKTMGKSCRREDMIKRIVANSPHFGDDGGKEILEKMDDTTLEKLDATAEDRAVALAEAEETKKINANSEPPIKEPHPEDKKPEDKPVEPVANKKMTMAEYLAAAPPEIAEMVSEGLSLRANEKKAMIDNIMKAPGNVFTQADLEKKDMKDLSGIVSLLNVNYSGRSGVTRYADFVDNNAEASMAPEPPSLLKMCQGGNK